MLDQYVYGSEEGEDKFLNEKYFKNKKNGFFVDIGAHSGIWSNKSIFFEECLGWDGICIEPSPINFAKLIENRRCKCINVALSDTEELVDFYVHDYINNGNVVTGYVVDGVIDGIVKNYPDHIKKEYMKELNSGKNKIIKIKTETFDSVMKDFDIKHIDFINIDTEGSELKILKGIDFNKYNIDFILLEKHENSNNIDEFLLSKGFDMIYNYFNNYIFKNRKSGYE